MQPYFQHVQLVVEQEHVEDARRGIAHPPAGHVTRILGIPGRRPASCRPAPSDTVTTGCCHATRCYASLRPACSPTVPGTAVRPPVAEVGDHWVPWPLRRVPQRAGEVWHVQGRLSVPHAPPDPRPRRNQRRHEREAGDWPPTRSRGTCAWRQQRANGDAGAPSATSVHTAPDAVTRPGFQHANAGVRSRDTAGPLWRPRMRTRAAAVHAAWPRSSVGDAQRKLAPPHARAPSTGGMRRAKKRHVG